MAEVDIHIAGRKYTIACRDGGEDHLRGLAQAVDKKASEAKSAVGDVNENRQLLFAALLLADELNDAKASPTPASTNNSAPAPDSYTAQALITLATRIETIADALEQRVANA